MILSRLCQDSSLLDAYGFGSLGEDKFVSYNLDHLQLFDGSSAVAAVLSDDAQRFSKLLDLARHTLMLADVEVDCLHPSITDGFLLWIRLLQERKDQLANSGGSDRMSICRW